MFLPVAIALLIAIPLYAVLIAGRRMGFNWAVGKYSPEDFPTAFSWAFKGLMVFGLLVLIYIAFTSFDLVLIGLIPLGASGLIVEACKNNRHSRIIGRGVIGTQLLLGFIIIFTFSVSGSWQSWNGGAIVSIVCVYLFAVFVTWGERTR